MPIIVGSGGSGANSTALFDVADLVLGCACAEMSILADEIAGYAGCPCYAYVSPGPPVLDHCCGDCNGVPGGQLSVHLEDVAESETFPSRATRIHPGCKAAVTVAAVVVTVARCSPGMKDGGRDPTADELTAISRTLSIDVHAIRRALACCVTAIPVAGKTKRRVQLTSVGWPGEQGDCASVEVRAIVEVGVVCSCAEGDSGSS